MAGTDATPVITAGTSGTPGFDWSGTVDGSVWRAALNCFVLVFGVFGNSLILRVYWPWSCERSTEVLIAGLAGVDLAVCLLRVRNVVELSCAMGGVQPPLAVRLLVAPSRVLMATSILLTGVIALDRYDSVCRINRWRFLSRRRAKIAVWVSVVVSVLTESPDILGGVTGSVALKKVAHVSHLAIFLTSLLMIVVCYGNVYKTVTRKRRIYTDPSPAVPTICQTLPTPGVSASALVSTSAPASASTMHPVKPSGSTPSPTPVDPGFCRPSEGRPVLPLPGAGASDARGPGRSSPAWPEPPRPAGHRRQPVREAMQQRVTRMLFFTSVVFLLTWLPFWIYVAADLVALSGGAVDRELLSKLYSAAVLAPVNSTVNPLIYGLANRHFRRKCAAILSKCAH